MKQGRAVNVGQTRSMSKLRDRLLLDSVNHDQKKTCGALDTITDQAANPDSLHQFVKRDTHAPRICVEALHTVVSHDLHTSHDTAVAVPSADISVWMLQAIPFCALPKPIRTNGFVPDGTTVVHYRRHGSRSVCTMATAWVDVRSFDTHALSRFVASWIRITVWLVLFSGRLADELLDCVDGDIVVEVAGAFKTIVITIAES